VSDRTWQDMPGWLNLTIRACRAAGSRTEDETVEHLTGRILAEEPEFARLLVSRYVRSLVRAPKPRKREKGDLRRDILMARCFRLSAEGSSLRAIGALLGISRQTVANYIAEWQMCLPEMAPAAIRHSRPDVNARRQSDEPALTPPIDNDPNVIQFRRLA
jgi:hypothetical protein